MNIGLDLYYHMCTYISEWGQRNEQKMGIHSNLQLDNLSSLAGIYCMC